MERLVYFELSPTPQGAIEREKQIKGWRRSKKIDLIREMNPTWQDLAAEWFEEGQTLRSRDRGAQGDVELGR
jgi:putative endonuclease